MRSKWEHDGSYRAWSRSEVLQILRAIAAEDVGVQSEGQTLLEILEDVYAQGGMDTVEALHAMGKVISPGMVLAALGLSRPVAPPPAEPAGGASDG